MNGTIHTFLSEDHRKCDEDFAQLEGHVAKSRWDEASSKFGDFKAKMLRHFEMEENTLFPRFEERTGMEGGPTQVMRIEHEQIRNLISVMEKNIDDKEQNGFLGNSESLMILVQQHNMKEEQMLYNMMDNLFGEESVEIVEVLKRVHGE